GYSGYFGARRDVFKGLSGPANSPALTVTHVPPVLRMPLYLGVGTGDGHYLDNNEQFATELRRLGWNDVSFDVVPAGHGWGASRRSCSQHSKSIRSPLAPMGWPNALSPPSGLTGSSPPRSKAPLSTSSQPAPRSLKPRSSMSTSSVGVKQSCTSAIASSLRGSRTPAWADASFAAATTP